MTFGSTEELFGRKREERPAAVRSTYLRSRDAREGREQSAKVRLARQTADEGAAGEKGGRTYVQPTGEGGAPALSSIRNQMRRSQQKQDELLQSMLDRSSDPSTG